MPLHVVRRKGSVYLWLSGTVRGHRIRESTGTADPRTAETVRAAREARLLEDAIFGRRPTVPFRKAADSYLSAEPRGYSQRKIVARLVMFLGARPTRDIGQLDVDQARAAILKPEAKASTVVRHIVSPINAILEHSARRDWCSRPLLEWPAIPKAPPRPFLPAEAEALVANASPHLQPLITFLFCTGARIGEAMRMDWLDVDLAASRVTFWEGTTKSGARRVVQMPPRAVAALAGLPLRDGRVFLRDDGMPYSLREGGGGPIRTGWSSACIRAELPGTWAEGTTKGGLRRHGRARRFRPEHTPHDCRHSWASWHYALHKDLLKLQHDGGWASAKKMEVYAHLIPEGQAAAVRAFWGLAQDRTGTPLTQRKRKTG